MLKSESICEEKSFTLSTKEDGFSCDVCKKRFLKKVHLFSHFCTSSSDKSYFCIICKNSLPSYCQLKDHVEIEHPGQRPFSCNVCGYEFMLEISLKSHYRKKHVKPLKYNICQKGCVNKKNLQSDTSAHTKEKTFECNICNKKFGTKSYLKAHLYRHAGEKKFVCNVCKKKCGTRPQLFKHMYIHTGEKPFTCEICQKDFRDSGCLKVHLRTHTGERPFQCDICQKSFTRRAYCNVHYLSHTESYKCNECNKLYKTKHTLRLHLKTHLKEKTFVCEICQKVYSRKHLLNKHYLQHPEKNLL